MCPTARGDAQKTTLVVPQRAWRGWTRRFAGLGCQRGAPLGALEENRNLVVLCVRKHVEHARLDGYE